MQKYVIKNHTVEAIQYIEENKEKVLKWLGDKKDIVAGICNKLSSPWKMGCWIVKDNEGFYISSDTVFKNDYIPTNNLFYNARLINLYDWDELVRNVYNRHYSFQQQGFMDRGLYLLEIDLENGDHEGFKNDELEIEQVNGSESGVSLKGWLARDPNLLPRNQNGNTINPESLKLFYHRNFYPHINEISADLCMKDYIAEGKYYINIDW